MLPCGKKIYMRAGTNEFYRSGLIVVSEVEWDTKEDPGKSMKNGLYVQSEWHGKRHLSG